MKYLLCLALVGCSSAPQVAPQSASPSAPQITEQHLVMDKEIQPMGRFEVIDAIKQCETSGLRAITIFGKRKINGYTAETIVEVTCGPKYL
jgi:hypothetical protein